MSTTAGSSTLSQTQKDYTGIVFDASCVFERAIDRISAPGDVARLCLLRAFIVDPGDMRLTNAIKRFFRRRGIPDSECTVVLYDDVDPAIYMALPQTRQTELLFALRAIDADLRRHPSRHRGLTTNSDRD